MPGNVSGVGLISAGSVNINSDGDIGDSTLPIGAAGYFLNVEVDSVEVTSNGSVSINALDRLKTTSLSAGEGRMVTLSAQGEDGEQRNDGTRETAIEATIQDVDVLQVTAPNGSIDILIQSSEDVTIGNPGAIGLGTALPMLAAGDVKIRTAGGSLENNVAVFDAPSAGSSAIHFDKTLLSNDLQEIATWKYDPGDEGVRASFLQGVGSGVLPAGLGLQLGDRVLFLGDNNVLPVSLNDRGGLDHSSPDPNSPDPWPTGHESTENVLIFKNPDTGQDLSLYEADQVTPLRGDSRPNWKPVALYEKDGDKFLVWRNDWLESTGTLQNGSNKITDIDPYGLTVGQHVQEGGGVAAGTIITAIDPLTFEVELNNPVSTDSAEPIANSIVRFEQNQQSKQFAVWGLTDIEGGFRWDESEHLLSPLSTAVFDLEEKYNIEINDDNVTGLEPYVESEGITKFGADSFNNLYAGGSKLLIDGEGVPEDLYLREYINDDNYLGFKPVAAEATDNGNFVIWQNVTGGIIVWLMNSQWSYQRTEIAPRPGSTEFFAFEEAIKTDLNKDGQVGKDEQLLATSLIRTDRSGVLRVGGYAVSRNSIDIREDTYPNWEAIAVSVSHVDDGTTVYQNRLLWQHAEGRLSVWEMNQQWGHESYGTVPTQGSPDWDKFTEEFGLPGDFILGTGPIPNDTPGGGREIGAEFSSEANGLYEVFDLGGTNKPWKLVRMPDRNTTVELPPSSFMKNVTTGDMYFVDYEKGNPEDRLFGKKVFNVERRDLSTVVETQDPNDTIQYIVSSGNGMNADAGTLGKMITLLEDNNPREDQDYEIAFQEVISTISLQQELPGITKSLTIDGGRRYIIDSEAEGPEKQKASIRDVVWSLNEDVPPVLIASYLNDAGAPVTTQASQIFINASGMFMKRNGEAVSQAALAGAEFDGLLFIGPNKGSEVRNLAFGNFNNGAAVTLDGSVDVSVLGNRFGQDWQGVRNPSDIGILVFDSDTTLIEENRIGPNGIGIQLEDSRDAVLVGNQVGVSAGENDIGIRVINSDDASSGNSIGVAPVASILVQFVRGEKEIDVSGVGADWIDTVYTGSLCTARACRRAPS